MALDLMREDACLSKAVSTFDDDAATKVQIVKARNFFINAIESEQLRSSICSVACGELRLAPAELRRVENSSERDVNWLLPPSMLPLEITLGYEQVRHRSDAEHCPAPTRFLPGVSLSLWSARRFRSVVSLVGSLRSDRGIRSEPYPAVVHRRNRRAYGTLPLAHALFARVR